MLSCTASNLEHVVRVGLDARVHKYIRPAARVTRIIGLLHRGQANRWRLAAAAPHSVRVIRVIKVIRVVKVIRVIRT